MDRTKAGYTEGVVSVIVNSALFGIKIWAGMVTGSIALMADAWHTLSDSLSSVIVIVAVLLSAKKPDGKHPFGYGRLEQIAALLIAFLLGVIAYDFLLDSIDRFNKREAITFGTIGTVVTIISIVTNEALAQYAFYIGRKTDNVTVKADGWHHRTDALSSVVVLVGIMFSSQFWWIDSVLGLSISFMLFYATYEIAREATVKLLGEKPSPGLVKTITNTIESVYEGNLQLHHIHLHNYGAHQELTFHIKLDNQLSIERGHKIATDIENVIYEELGIIATVHVEPKDFVHASD